MERALDWPSGSRRAPFSLRSRLFWPIAARPSRTSRAPSRGAGPGSAARTRQHRATDVKELRPLRLCKDLREYLLENVRPLEYVDREEAFVRTHTDSVGPSRIGNYT